MDPVTIGIVGIAVLVVIFLLGMPVGFTMAFVGLIGFALVKGPEAGLSILARDFWDTWSSYNLTVIPMFVFMGSVAFYAGMSGRLYKAAYIIFGNGAGDWPWPPSSPRPGSRPSAARRAPRRQPWARWPYRRCGVTGTILDWPAAAWRLRGVWGS